MEFWKILKKIIERVRKFFRDVDENGKRFGHNMQAQPWPDDLKAPEQPAEKFNTLLTAAKENEQTYGSRESGARFARGKKKKVITFLKMTFSRPHTMLIVMLIKKLLYGRKNRIQKQAIKGL